MQSSLLKVRMLFFANCLFAVSLPKLGLVTRILTSLTNLRIYGGWLYLILAKDGITTTMLILEIILLNINGGNLIWLVQ
jgi:hypothetical protein